MSVEEPSKDGAQQAAQDAADAIAAEAATENETVKEVASEFTAAVASAEDAETVVAVAKGTAEEPIAAGLTAEPADDIWRRVEELAKAVEAKEAESTAKAATTDADAVETAEPEAAELEAAQQAEAEPASALAKLSTGAWIGIVVAALVIGLLIGGFAINCGGGSLGGKTTLAEGELDSAVATYNYNGSRSITARQVIEQSSSLESAKDADGNYAIPSADSILSTARNEVVLAEAEKRGLTATDEEISAYAEQAIGSSDYASIAQSYGMEESTVVGLLKNSCMMSKLRDEVIGSDASAAAAPEAPEEGKSKAEYATYIINLAGSEWDAEKGAWASEDGAYATALKDYKIKADSATYEAANAAYQVAYQAYSEQASATSSQWTDFVNGLLANANITIYTMLS